MEEKACSFLPRALSRSLSLSSPDSLLHSVHKTYFKSGRSRRDIKGITTFNVTGTMMSLYFPLRRARNLFLLFQQKNMASPVISIRKFVK
jgi:hypothetical protein